jgi:hypothetical protein
LATIINAGNAIIKKSIGERAAGRLFFLIPATPVVSFAQSQGAAIGWRGVLRSISAGYCDWLAQGPAIGWRRVLRPVSAGCCDRLARDPDPGLIGMPIQA